MKKTFQIIVSVVLILVGLGVFFYPNFREWKTNHEVNQIVDQFEEDFKTDDTES